MPNTDMESGEILFTGITSQIFHDFACFYSENVRALHLSIHPWPRIHILTPPQL